jgi:hypothetical protein
VASAFELRELTAMPDLRDPDCALKWPFVTSAQLARLRSTGGTNAKNAIGAD